MLKIDESAETGITTLITRNIDEARNKAKDENLIKPFLFMSNNYYY